MEGTCQEYSFFIFASCEPLKLHQLTDSHAYPLYMTKTSMLQNILYWTADSQIGSCLKLLTTGKKLKSTFLTWPCHKIYRVEVVDLKSCNYALKIMIFVNMWNLGQFQ